ncbi:MAG: type II secretion system protein [Candidatus Aureabacteria bacterium]|nr:type II secretion system protein [Candidatus Auribacterota bacterium]
MKDVFKKGFFLIEVSVTLLIVGIMLVAFVSTFSSALKGIKRIRQFSSAADISRKQVFEVIGEFRQTRDPITRTGQQVLRGYTYRWEATFEPLEDTQESLYIMTFKVIHEGYEISKITTLIQAP